MKYIILSFLMVGSFSFSKNKEEKAILGKWKLEINLKEQLKEASEDLNLFEKLVVRSVSGLVQSVWEDIDVTFEFKKNQQLMLYIEVDLEEKETEVETLSWKIDADGKIFIADIQNEKVKISNDGYWKLKEGKLLFYNAEDELEENIFMLKKDE